MCKLIKDIYKFNKDAGLLEDGMDPFLEMSFILEEVFEQYEGVYSTLKSDGTPAVPGDLEYPTASQLGISLANSIKDGMERRNLPMPLDVNELDRAIDIVIFSIGKMFKMGLSQEQVEECFNIVNSANMAKIGAAKSKEGKQLKPEGWEPPEDKLQVILDKRPKKD